MTQPQRPLPAGGQPDSASPVLPLVTIAMPCLNEEAYIEACLRSIQSQDYPRDRLELLVADGRSSDGTPGVLERLRHEDARLQVIDNPERLQAAGMNAAIRRASGEVIVRMDVHCEYAPDYVRRCVETLERTGADNVGGAQRARARGRFQDAVCRALRSPLGVGGAAYRSEEREGWVDTVFLGAFRRRVFETAGLYDPKAFTNEDAELNQRLLGHGGRIFLSREIVVHYYPRSSLIAVARQYFRYGQGRARTLLKHGRLRSLRPMLPFLGVLGALGLLVIPALRPLFPWAIILYAVGVAAEAIRVTKAGAMRLTPLVALIFPVLHVSHGLGFGVGLVRFALRPDWGPVERLEAGHSAPTEP